MRLALAAGSHGDPGTRFAFFFGVRHLRNAVQQSRKHRPWRAFFLAPLVFAVGCSVAALDLEAGPASQNQCSKSTECGEGQCVGGQCRATTGTIRTLLLEVTPPGDGKMSSTELGGGSKKDSIAIGGVRFVRDVRDLPAKGGDFTVVLDHVARIDGTVTGPSANQGSHCVPPDAALTGVVGQDGSFPARVTLTPRERLLGIASAAHTSETQLVANTGNRFAFNVPQGAYDVYVEPLAPLGSCAIPPQLFVDAQILEGGVNLGLVLPSPQHLDVSVRWRGKTPALDGWTLDIVEQDSGRVLSTEARLASPKLVGSEFWYQALVAYSPAQVAAGVATSMNATELVRLSPPDGVTAPVVIVQRSVVELFQQGQGVIDQLEELPAPVKVTGRVSVAGGLDGKAATVTLVATELRGMATGTVAAFQRVVQTDDAGQFQVDLLPGKYRVFAAPQQDTGLAVVTTTWDIAATTDVQAGRLVELVPASSIQAEVHDVTGRAVGGAPVQAAASPTMSVWDVLDRALGKAPFVPRSEVTVSRSDGLFSVQADPGLFDLSIRPDCTTGFAWLVRPAVKVASQDVDLGTVVLPLPVEYRGHLYSKDVNIVPSALVRAYAYLETKPDGSSVRTDDPAKATSVIQVAETRANDQGNFVLLLPAAF